MEEMRKPTPDSCNNDVDTWIVPPGTHPLEVAVVHESLEKESCGHRVVLDQLVQHLSTAQSCPVCKANVLMICDAPSSLTQERGDDDDNVVMFKYGKQTYRLTAKKLIQRRSWWWSSTSSFVVQSCTAQERIAHALHLNPNSTKILSKGKVLYPSTATATATVATNSSNRILQISAKDGKKSSLVVMGTRRGYELKMEHGDHNKSLLGILICTVWHWTWASVKWLYGFTRQLPPSSHHED